MDEQQDQQPTVSLENGYIAVEGQADKIVEDLQDALQVLAKLNLDEVIDDDTYLNLVEEAKRTY